MWGDIGEAQQSAWLAVMQATLSTEGYNRVLAEWNADEALAAEQGSGGGGPGGQLLFGKKYYWVALIGTPSETEPWQWQFGGHHGPGSSPFHLLSAGDDPGHPAQAAARAGAPG